MADEEKKNYSLLPDPLEARGEKLAGEEARELNLLEDAPLPKAVIWQVVAPLTLPELLAEFQQQGLALKGDGPKAQWMLGESNLRMLTDRLRELENFIQLVASQVDHEHDHLSTTTETLLHKLRETPEDRAWRMRVEKFPTNPGDYHAFVEGYRAAKQA